MLHRTITTERHEVAECSSHGMSNMSPQWASYQIRKIAGCAWAGNAGNIFPAVNICVTTYSYQMPVATNLRSNICLLNRRFDKFLNSYELSCYFKNGQIVWWYDENCAVHRWRTAIVVTQFLGLLYISECCSAIVIRRSIYIYIYIYNYTTTGVRSAFCSFFIKQSFETIDCRY